MRDNLSPVFISSEIQKQETVTSVCKVLLKCQQNTQAHLQTGIHKKSSVAGYSAMAVYILSDAELHISKKLTAIKKGINISKVQFFLILLITCNIDNNCEGRSKANTNTISEKVYTMEQRCVSVLYRASCQGQIWSRRLLYGKNEIIIFWKLLQPSV